MDDYVYVGGEDMIEEGVFRWISGESVQGIPWRSGQPNNDRNVEHCMAMKKSESFKFYDRPCSKKYSFLCQKSL